MNYRELLIELDRLSEEELDQDVTVAWDNEVFGVEYVVVNDEEDSIINVGQFVLHAE
jgi:hypothetical protein